MSETTGYRFDALFTLATAFMAEGRRAGICTCRVCGVAILLEMEVDAPRLHAEFAHADKLDYEPK